jgi:predicted HTH domain antitoxin
MPLWQANVITRMSTQITIDLPDGAFSALRQDKREFVSELRLAAAAKWYEVGKLSQAKAAELAGLSRADFISALARFGVSPFQVSPADLAREIGAS